MLPAGRRDPAYSIFTSIPYLPRETARDRYATFVDSNRRLELPLGMAGQKLTPKRVEDGSTRMVKIPVDANGMRLRPLCL